jgi:hypothetical protein
MTTLNDLFHDAREMAGGSEESELSGRYPDLRLWRAYDHTWRRLLAQRVKLANASFVTAQVLPAGADHIALASTDQRIGPILIASGSDYDRLIPTSRAQLEGQWKVLTDTGIPACYFVDTDEGKANIYFYPVPAESVPVTIFGSGRPTPELVEATCFDTSGMLLSAWPVQMPPITDPVPTSVEAKQPEHFTLSCAAWLTSFIHSSDERTKGTNIELTAQKAFQFQFMSDLGSFFTACGPVTAVRQRTNPRLRLR